MNKNQDEISFGAGMTFETKCKNCKRAPADILLFRDVEKDTDGLIIKCGKCKEVILKVLLKDRISSLFEKIEND